MKFKHNTLIFISGFVWLAIGVFLLALGLRFILMTLRMPALLHMDGFSISLFFSRFTPNPSNCAVLVITCSLMLGYFKGRMVLVKSVKRQLDRIASLPNPAPLKYLYGKGYYLLIASMVSLGFVMRFLPITLDTRGAIDTVIGSALVNGALLYFREIAQNAYHKKAALTKSRK